MAFGQGFAGGYSDLLEAPPHHPRRGGSGGRAARYRLAPWAAPRPPEPPPKPDPVRIRVAMHGTWSIAARVTRLDTWTTIPLRARASVRLVGPPQVLHMHRLDRRARDAEELAEVALMVRAVEAWW